MHEGTTSGIAAVSAPGASVTVPVRPATADLALPPGLYRSRLLRGVAAWLVFMPCLLLINRYLGPTRFGNLATTLAILAYTVVDAWIFGLRHTVTPRLGRLRRSTRAGPRLPHEWPLAAAAIGALTFALVFTVGKAQGLRMKSCLGSA